MAEQSGDAPFITALTAISESTWSDLWAAYDALAGESEFATWGGGEAVDVVIDGEDVHSVQMPYPVYSPMVSLLTDTLARAGLVVPFDWMSWDGPSRYPRGAGLDVAPVTDAVRMVTAVFRSERFSDGSIEGALEDGTLPAALNRIRRWYSDERSRGR